MSRIYILWLSVILIGVFLFVYGSNYYSAVVGWTGIFLMIGGCLSGIALKVYESVRKKENGQKP